MKGARAATLGRKGLGGAVEQETPASSLPWGATLGDHGRVIRSLAKSALQPYTLWGSTWGSAVSSVCREWPNDRELYRPGARVSAAQSRRAPAEETELRPQAGVCPEPATPLLHPAASAGRSRGRAVPPTASREPSSLGPSGPETC